jgi:hypothetical protein
MLKDSHIGCTIARIAAAINGLTARRPSVFVYRKVSVRLELGSAGVYEAYIGPFWLVRGQTGADYRAAKALACQLIDWMSAGYTLVYHPNGDVGVWVESRDETPRERLIYSAPSRVGAGKVTPRGAR